MKLNESSSPPVINLPSSILAASLFLGMMKNRTCLTLSVLCSTYRSRPPQLADSPLPWMPAKHPTQVSSPVTMATVSCSTGEFVVKSSKFWKPKVIPLGQAVILRSCDTYVLLTYRCYGWLCECVCLHGSSQQTKDPDYLMHLLLVLLLDHTYIQTHTHTTTRPDILKI